MSRRAANGSVYLMALIVVLAVSATAVAMAETGGLRLREGDALAARTMCRNAALGVLRATVNDLTTTLAAGGNPALVTVRPGGESIDGCTVVMLGRDPTGSALTFGLISEAGKVDVNHASAEVLAALPGMNSAIAAAIVDWRDADDTASDGGAERTDGAYAGAAVPYAPRNAPIEAIDELRLVRGVTDPIWAGEDADGDGVLDPGEDANANGRLDLGLRDTLTIESREVLTAPDGTPRTNLANAGALRARLVALFGSERGTALADRAQAARPLTNRLDLIAALELDDADARALWPTVIGPEGRLGLCDAASASEAVLIAVVGSDVAARVLAARPADAATAGPSWLAEALGRQGAATVGGRLTVGSYRFRADLLAVRDDGAGWARIETILDASTGVVRVVSLRPAEALGWPLAGATPDLLRRGPRASDVATYLTTGRQ